MMMPVLLDATTTCRGEASAQAYLEGGPPDGKGTEETLTCPYVVESTKTDK